MDSSHANCTTVSSSHYVNLLLCWVAWQQCAVTSAQLLHAEGFSLSRSVGTPGTAAVVAAYYWHLDPYGHFHWSSVDALAGLACAVPIAVLGAALHDPAGFL